MRIREWLVASDWPLHATQTPYDQLGACVQANLGIGVGSRAVRAILDDLHRQQRVVKYQGARAELYCLRPPYTRGRATAATGSNQGQGSER